MPEPAEGRAEQRFGINYTSSSSKLFISCAQAFISVHIRAYNFADTHRYKRLYTFIFLGRYKRDMCMSISCVYNKSDMHRYKRLYLLVYVNTIVQIQTDMNVYIRLYF